MIAPLIALMAFLIQLFKQLSVERGWFNLKYTTTTPMYEDGVTTILFCTFLITLAIRQ